MMMDPTILQNSARAAGGVAKELEKQMGHGQSQSVHRCLVRLRILAPNPKPCLSAEYAKHGAMIFD